MPVALPNSDNLEPLQIMPNVPLGAVSPIIKKHSSLLTYFLLDIKSLKGLPEDLGIVGCILWFSLISLILQIIGVLDEFQSCIIQIQNLRFKKLWLTLFRHRIVAICLDSVTLYLKSLLPSPDLGFTNAVMHFNCSLLSSLKISSIFICLFLQFLLHYLEFQCLHSASWVFLV